MSDVAAIRRAPSRLRPPRHQGQTLGHPFFIPRSSPSVSSSPERDVAAPSSIPRPPASPRCAKMSKSSGIVDSFAYLHWFKLGGTVRSASSRFPDTAVAPQRQARRVRSSLQTSSTSFTKMMKRFLRGYSSRSSKDKQSEEDKKPNIIFLAPRRFSRVNGLVMSS
ncbi:uncharacterized protein [Triticum aestivum]|uniref:uncharacterized protein n=1 Tax=Triticum aestivum TaxID=4565 RepID=UPI001D01FA4C|nr:uncharacterized protein LOC123133950 [Triticum aestivum]